MGMVQAEALGVTLIRQRGHGLVRCPNSCWSPALRRKRDRLKPGLQRAVPTRRRHLDLNHAQECAPGNLISGRKLLSAQEIGETPRTFKITINNGAYTDK